MVSVKPNEHDLSFLLDLNDKDRFKDISYQIYLQNKDVYHKYCSQYSTDIAHQSITPTKNAEQETSSAEQISSSPEPSAQPTLKTNSVICVII
jgi:hypothetical protein